MSRRPIRVTTGEMELLSLLWDEGPVTLRRAHERFPKYGSPIQYPTMQTRLNRLVEKKLAARSSARPATYSATVTKDQVTLGHLRQIAAKLTQGDIVPLMARLLSEQTLSAEQLDQLQGLLKQAQKKHKPSSKRRRSS